MKTFVVLILVIAGSSLIYSIETNSLFESAPEFKWTKAEVKGSGAHEDEWKPGNWPKGIKPLIAFDNKLWVVGQKLVWISADAINWQVHDKNDWGERISHKIIFFRNKLWMSGGLRYADKTFLNDIWSSEDGTNWQLEKKNAEWSPRRGHTLIEFKNKLWLLGGADGVDEYRASDKFLNDIWSSDDGITWRLEISSAPWEPRDDHRVIEFNNELWLIGGQGHSDIWKSGDGKNWKKVRDESPWKNRYDYGALAYEDILWVFGGHEKVSTNAFNDVWYSLDGKNWELHSQHAPWTKRSAVASVVFKNKLWIFSGKCTGCPKNWSDDVWMMEPRR